MDKVIGGEFTINTENYLNTVGNIPEGGYCIHVVVLRLPLS